MYKIETRDGTVLYDTSEPDERYSNIVEPVCTMEIGQPGSLQFSILPTHPMYYAIEPMRTYLSAFEGDDSSNLEEIFYGRVIDVNINAITGIKEVQCAGALSFLEDGEHAPYSEKGGQKKTGEAFFTECITQYNSEINQDPNRKLLAGVVTHSKKTVQDTFNITSYTNIKSVLETNLINSYLYGGYFKIQRDNNGNHYVIWTDSYSNAVRTARITLSENVISQENAISANDFYTMIRPVGSNNLTTDQGVYPISNDLVNTYGRIIRTVNFSDKTTKAALESAVTSYINNLVSGFGKNGTIKVIDMHFLNSTAGRIKLGTKYTNISGFENEPMIVAAFTKYFGNPSDDEVTLKNEKELFGSGRQYGGKGRGRGRSSGKTNETFQNVWEHISETEKTLSLHADEIYINGSLIQATTQQFELYAQSNDKALDEIRGSAAFINSDFIDLVSGTYSVSYYVVPRSKITETTNPSAHGWYEYNKRAATEADKTSTSVDVFYARNDPSQGIRIFDPTHPDSRGKVPGTRFPKKANLVVGSDYYFVSKTSDTSPQTNLVVDHNESKIYLSRGLEVQSGAEMYLDDNGQYVNIWDEVKDEKGNIQTVLTSALWTERNSITGLVGDLEVVEDPPGSGIRKLLVKTGGGILIQKNNVRVGVFDDDNLTGGMIVDKLDDGTVTTKIKGDIVDITADQVRIGSTTDRLSAWMQETGQDISDLDGLVADVAHIAEVNAQHINTVTAKVATLETDYLKTRDLESEIADINVVQTKGINCPEGGIFGNGLIGNNIYFYDSSASGNLWSIKNFVSELRVDPNHPGVLQKKSYNDSDWVDVGTFSGAISEMRDVWDANGNVSVLALPQNVSHQVNQTLKLQGNGSSNNCTADLGIQSSSSFTVKKRLSIWLALSGTGSTAYVGAYDNSSGTGSPYAQVSVSSVWSAGYNYDLPDGIDVGDITNAGTSTPSGATAISGLNPNAIWTDYSGSYGYIKFSVSAHNKKKWFYFPFDSRELYSGGSNNAYKSGYDDGWAAAYSRVRLPGNNTTSSSMVVKTPPSTVNGEAVETTYAVSVAKATADIKSGSQTKARVEHDRYGQGWRAFFNKTSLPVNSTSSASMVVKRPNSTTDSDATEYTYTVSIDNDYAYIKSGTAVKARVANSTYAVTAAQVSADNFQMIPTVAGSSQVSGKKYLGKISRPTQSSWLAFRLNVHGSHVNCYITLE